MKTYFKGIQLVALSICLFITNFSTNIFLDVSAEDYVAKVNGKDYTSIESAVDSIEDEGTVEVIANTSLDKQITIEAGKSVTIKGGDYTIELASSSTAFKIEKDGSLTIDGNLTFTTKDENTKAQSFVYCNGSFKFNNGTIDMKNGILGSGSLINVTGPEAEFIFNNGTIKNTKNGGGVFVDNQASFIMNGGTISNCSAYLYGGGVLVEGKSKDSSAVFTMNGGVIEKCQALYGGGVCIRYYNNDGKAEMIMNGGTIRDNIAKNDNNNPGAGGGIMIWDNADSQNVYSSEHISLTMKDGEISNNSVPYGMGGGIACCGGKFTMEGGSINNNKASSTTNGCGGGVYIATSGVTLNGGKIQNNEAGLQGGGVYCGSTPYIVKVYNAVIKENKASITGGGVWACPTGDVKVFITNGVAVYDNTAEKAGDDVASIKNTNSEDYVLTLSDRMLGGGQVFWYLDGKLNTTQKGDESENRLGVPDDSVQRYPDTDPNPITDINNATDSYVLKAVASDNAKSLAMSTASLLITGNSAPRGGGIGTNGGFIMGEENNDYSLIVKKVWENTTDESLKKELTVYLKINETELDSVKLNSNNDWTATFDDLPSPDSLDNVSYAVVEDPVPDNFIPSYSQAEVDNDARTIKIDVTNTYSPPLGGLTISKTVKGDVPNYQKEFKFRVTFTDENGNPIEQEFNYTGSKEGMIKSGGTITLKHDESITINDLPAGTKYTVSEVDIPDGYTPDKSEKSGVIVGNEVTGLEYINNYKVTPTVYTPQVTKTLTGQTPPSDKRFTFNITASENNPNGAVLPENTTATVTGSGTASFDNIKFTKAGTYNFEIKEEQGNEPGYSYDGSVWTLTVEVTDENSQLKVSKAEYTKIGAQSSDEASFENSYSTTKVSYAPQVEKEITGDKTPSDKTFTFNIEASEDNPDGAEMPEDTTATVTGEGTTSFGNITFTKAGTYIFKISETKGNDAGYTYDESVYTLKVIVEDVDSALTIKSRTYEKEGGESSEERALFTNTYSVEPTEYAPQVEKTVTGNTPSDETFTFNIKASADNPDGVEMPEDTTATVRGAGSTNFDKITFTKVGTYTFEISEEKGNVSGYTYDESVWTLTVVVVDNESKLEVQSHTYTKADGTASEDKAEFENIYIPTTEPTNPTSPTDPTTPTTPTKPTNPTNSTEPTNTTNPTSPTEPKKTTTTKRTASNPPYSKSQNNKNTKGGNNGNTPDTGSESDRNLPIAFLVTFLLGLNTVYFSFRRGKFKGRKAK